MRKRNFILSVLVVGVTLTVPHTLRAQCMANSLITPSSYVPFSSIYYISAPDAAGDLLVVGSMTAANYSGLSGVPEPDVPNELFCDPITLAPGIVARAYVPTLAEREGNFSAFNGLLFDPTCGASCPYAGGLITTIPTVFAWRIPAAQPDLWVYVSNDFGGQILTVNGSSGVTSVLFPADDYGDRPLSMTVGPDNLIYAASPQNSRIFRIDQSGGSFATVYDIANDATGPTQPVGLSFGTTGRLTFDGQDDDGVWQISFNSTDTPGTPVQIIPAANGAVLGGGVTFNLADELLIADYASNVVLQQTAPGASTTTTLIGSANLSTPLGIAMNSSGNIFVANLNNPTNCTISCPTFTNGGYIRQFTSGGTFVNTYATFSAPDAPVGGQFDASGNLYVVTIQDWFADHGKVWLLPAVAPGSTSTPILLVDLGYAYSNGTVPGLSSGEATGVALPATSFTTPQQPVASPTTVIFTNGNIINQTVSIPSGSSMGGAYFMAVNFEQWSPTLFDTTRLPATSTNTWSGGTPVPSGTTCTPIAGTGGNCLVIEDLCFDSNHDPIVPCQIFAPSGSLIGLTSVYQTQSAQPNPGLIIADDGENDWANITTGYSAADPTIKGGTKGLNTDTAIVNVGGCPNVSIELDPSSVSRGGITIVTAKVASSCASTAQTVVMTFTLEGPVQPNTCSSTESFMFKTPPFELRPDKRERVSFLFWVPERTCAGTYNVVATTKSVSGVLLDISSASLTVKKH